MTSPPNPTPSPSENESSADDPEWIKGVVAKALLQATAGDPEVSGNSIGEPIEPTPAVRATASWPTMSTSIPEMAPLADLPDPVQLNTAAVSRPVATPATPLATQLPDPKPLVISPAVQNRTALPAPAPTVSAPAPTASAPAVPSPAPLPASTTPTDTPTPTVPEPAQMPSQASVGAPPTERPPRMTSFAPATLEHDVAESIIEREPAFASESSTAVATVPDTAVQDAPLIGHTPSRLSDEPADLDQLVEHDLVEYDEVMVETDATTEGYRSSDLRTILEWLAVIVAALVVALLIKAFVLQAFWIPSESMETTVNEGDRILVNKVSYNLHEVRRGDLVVFEKLEGTPGDTKDLIKRAIALPGETIEVRADGRIWIWGAGETPEDAKLLEEPYLDPQNAILAVPSSSDPANQTIWDDRCVNQENPGRCTLDENSFFMMGDNRFRSLDSRSFGPVPAENIVGRAFLRIWPPGDISTL